MLRSTVFLFGALVSGASCLAATPVWESTFDATADGVVDIVDSNLGKVMIGANSGGTQTITTQDNLTNAFTPDKAGREIVGGGVTGSDAFSGLYRFSWSAVDETATQPLVEQYEAIGFIGGLLPQTRPIMGSVIRHWKEGTDYFVGLDLAFGAVGITNFGYNAGPGTVGAGFAESTEGFGINLGPNMLGTNYQIAIGFDPTDNRLTAGMYTEAGDLIQSQTGIIELSSIDPEGIISPPFGTGQQELDAFIGTHLGWSDYTGNFADGLTVWEVDSLAYFDSADGAFPGAVIDGDLNVDGFVGVDDLNLILLNWNATVTPGDLGLGDPTGDGFVGVDDLNIVLVNWNNGTPPPPAGAAAIPEPASLALVSVGGLAVLRRRPKA